MSGNKNDGGGELKLVSVGARRGGLLTARVTDHEHGPNCSHDHDHGATDDDDHAGHDHSHDHAARTPLKFSLGGSLGALAGRTAQRGHDHSHDHGAHDHGAHDHAAHDHAAHDHSGHDHAGHDHAAHDHDGHDHSGHSHAHEHTHVEREPTHLAAETGGTALQLDLEAMLSGETDDKGRFEQLERALELTPGVLDVHLRRDQGFLQVCIHYDHTQQRPEQMLVLCRTVGARISRRYVTSTWFVRGMDSPQCATVVEHSLTRLPGVLSANVAYAAERLVLEYDRDVLTEKDITKRVQALGHDLDPVTHGSACSHHHHQGGLAPVLAMPLSVASGVCLTLGFVLEKTGVLTPAQAIPLYAIALATGGVFAARDALNSVRQFRFDIETLMVLAAVGAGLLGAWFEGGFLLFLFSLGHSLEHRAMDRARQAIEALSKLRPQTAFIRRNGSVTELDVGSVRRGDIMVVRPGDRVALDGVVREGHSSLDQAAITGESVPVARGPGEDVFAGSINVERALDVEVTRLSNESAISRVVDLVTQAEAQKSPTQRFTARVERIFVPIILVAAPVLATVLYMTGSPLTEALLRAISMLVAASPCALAISTPSAVLSAVARAARGGVLMKGGAYLESLGRVKTLAFDKTGTLTLGKPRLITVKTHGDATEDALLEAAASAETLTSHPLAHAVVKGAQERGLKVTHADGLEVIHGRGIRAHVGGVLVEVGSLEMFEAGSAPESLATQVTALQDAGQTTMVVRRDGTFLGVMGVADTPRPEAKEMLKRLEALGIHRTVMLSGDNIRVARAVASQLGIREPRAPLMPEDKVRNVRELAKEGGVAMVGDGVNDAPALATASVGIAMGGAGSDVALETADVVLMGDDLRRLPFAVALARDATAAIRQNLVISLGVSAVLVVASVLGWVRIAEAVILHEGSTLLVVANGLRLLAWRDRTAG